MVTLLRRKSNLKGGISNCGPIKRCYADVAIREKGLKEEVCQTGRGERNFQIPPFKEL